MGVIFSGVPRGRDREGERSAPHTPARPWASVAAQGSSDPLHDLCRAVAAMHSAPSLDHPAHRRHLCRQNV